MKLLFFIFLFLIILVPSDFAENIGVSQTGGMNIGVSQTDAGGTPPASNNNFPACVFGSGISRGIGQGMR